jgi:hypothetical protein
MILFVDDNTGILFLKNRIVETVLRITRLAFSKIATVFQGSSKIVLKN